MKRLEGGQPPALTDGARPASVAPRGYGRVQRQVWRCFIAFPAKDLSTGDLVAWCYPRTIGKPNRHGFSVIFAWNNMFPNLEFFSVLSLLREVRFRVWLAYRKNFTYLKRQPY